MQRFAHPLGQCLGGGQGLPRQDNAEFLTAHPRDQMGRRGERTQMPAERLQHVIARGVTMAIVDLLEVVVIQFNCCSNGRPVC